MPPPMVVMVNDCYHADIPLIIETALTVGNSMICDWNHAFKNGTIGQESMDSGDETLNKTVSTVDKDFMDKHETAIQKS